MRAYERYVACMDRAGFTVELLDDSGPVLEYRLPGAAVDSGDDERCYAAEFADMDTAWQLLAEQDAD
ncbi:hypothetical protein [Cellulomonas sp. Marseille-Q8402]